MLSRLSDRLAAFFRATAPDPFVIAVLLTVLTIVLSLVLTDASLAQALRAWAGADPADATKLTGAGVWRFLGFAMQMCLILITGHVIAASAPVSALLDRVAGMPRSGAQAAVVVAAAACVLGAVNWGLGLMAGAILARRVGLAMSRRGVRAHYPLLAAAGYTAMMVWHGGFSGSAPLTASTAAGLAATLPSELAASMTPIPLSRTLLSPMNLVITGGLLMIVPLTAGLLMPRKEAEVITAERFVPREMMREHAAEESPGLIPRLLERTPAVNLVLAAMIGFWAWGYYLPADLSRSGVMNLGLDAVNLTALMLALVLHPTPRKLVNAVDDAARHCGGIILQFPLYAGIMGVMTGTGLTAVLAGGIASGATPGSLPVLTFAAACVINLFIPSGGGQWAVQGPIALEAARSLGVAPEKIVMAIAYGDQLTNMLQPFWALPLLAITGVRARDIIGYTAVLMVIAGAWIGVWMVVLA